MATEKERQEQEKIEVEEPIYNYYKEKNNCIPIRQFAFNFPSDQTKKTVDVAVFEWNGEDIITTAIECKVYDPFDALGQACKYQYAFDNVHIAVKDDWLNDDEVFRNVSKETLDRFGINLDIVKNDNNVEATDKQYENPIKKPKYCGNVTYRAAMYLSIKEIPGGELGDVWGSKGFMDSGIAKTYPNNTETEIQISLVTKRDEVTMRLSIRKDIHDSKKENAQHDGISTALEKICYKAINDWEKLEEVRSDKDIFKEYDRTEPLWRSDTNFKKTDYITAVDDEYKKIKALLEEYGIELNA
ncbi:MAG: hypothetical protein BK997_01070 [Candidatus Micrarchaeum sp. ARMAN-1]|jgi:hypothetical protein|nr:MAG: hypothetical protein BK997_01070 [Candidatus Micrarchaeum sp. ARMAN-1]